MPYIFRKFTSSLLIITFLALGMAFPHSSKAISDPTVFENNLIRFSFTHATTFRLASITNLTQGNSFTFSDDSLWSLNVYNPATRQYTLITDAAGGTVSSSLSPISGGTRFTIQWVGVPIVTGENADVTITGDLLDGSAIADWRLSVQHNLSSRILESASLSLGIIPVSGEDNFALIPYRGGHEIRNPATNVSGNEYFGYISSPTQAIAQLYPYYTASGKGLYIATHDGAGWHKKFGVHGNGSRYRLTLTQPIPNVFSSTSFSFPYPFRVGVYSGQWFEAAQIYKQWAHQQSWMNRGPLISRTDIPQWLKDTEYMSVSAGSPAGSAAQVSAYTALKQYYDQSHMGIWWQGGTSDPFYQVVPTGFRTTVQQLRANNIYSFVYTYPQTYRLTDPPLPSNATDAFVKSIDGVALQVGEYYKFDPSTSYLQSKAQTLAQSLAAEGIAGAYIDVVQPFDDYSTSSSRTHSPGGGTYGIHAFRTMFDTMRSTFRSTLPSLGIIYTEVAAENYIGSVDFMISDFMTSPLTQNTLADRWVPLFQALYHRYTLTWPSTERVYSTAVLHPDHYDAVNALGFTSGNILADRQDCFIDAQNYPQAAPTPTCAVLGAGQLTIQMPLLQDHVQFMKRMVDARRRSREFLVYGDMMKPLSLSVPSQTYFFNDSVTPGLQDKTVSLPNVMHSVWRADNGDLGIVLTNHTPTAQTVPLSLPLSEYGFSGTRYLYEVLEGEDLYRSTVTGTLSLNEAIPRKSVLVLRLSTQAPDLGGPTTSITAPASNATVSGTVAFSATASDPSGVAGVQFLLDGTPFGSEDTSAPYTISFDSTTVTNGGHTLRALGRDTLQNTTLTAPLSFTVSNNAPVTTSIPQAPDDINAVATTSGYALIEWNDNASNETGYVIERGSGSSSSFGTLATIGSNRTSYQDVTVTPGSSYRYRVYAYNTAGNSSSITSGVVAVPSGGTVVPPPPPPPSSSLAAPTNLSVVSLTSASIRLTWNDNSSNESGFILEHSTNGTQFIAINTFAQNATQFTYNGLVPGSLHYYRLRAFNAQGASTYSNTISITLPTSGASEAFTLTLQREMEHPQVRTLQQFLARDPSLYPEGIISGYFGGLTEAAVRRFQTRHGIQENGVVGSATRAKLNSLYTTTPPPPTPPAGDVFTITLRKGMTHEQVRLLQIFLAKNPALYPEGTVSGYFGSLTEAAVKRFQAKYGIASSGTPLTTGYGAVGPRTRAKLNELYSGTP